MRLIATKLLAFLFLLPCVALEAQKSVPKIASFPSWITVNPVNYSNSKQDAQAEDGYIDALFEKQISLSEKSVYYKKGIRILSETGVENTSKISLSFDPTYQEIIFHSVQIIREGKQVNKLDVSKIKTLQQEKDLDRNLYDGSLSAVIILDDIRKGDILEYSYTIKGINPIFKDKYADMLEAQFSVPVNRLFYKLIVPAGRTMAIKNSKTSVKPTVTVNSGTTVYEWSFNEVPPVIVDDNIPSWYDPYPMVILSEYKSWKEVAQWGSSLFPMNIQLSQPLVAKIDEIKNRFQTDEDRVLAALRFVQDDIRYMGIEMGTNSHKPYHPNKVFTQRFGDCKDKSYLLCIMLGAMNITAHPVLINTTYKKTLKDWLPSANVFDHVTVRVQLNHSTYWFDPTITYQRGKLKDISYPDYQVGLVLSDNTEDLVAIPLQDKGMVQVKEVIKVLDMFGKAKLKVLTKYTGSNADYLRREFESSSLREKKKEYTDYYKAYFEKITIDSLSYTDDEETGLFTTVEQYTIDNVWGNKRKFKELLIQPYVLDGVIKKVTDDDRTMPFAVSFPVAYKEEIEVVLPKEWNAEGFDEEIETNAFRLGMHYTGKGNRINLHYEYHALKDFVEPKDLAQYASSMKRLSENMGYSISESSSFASNESTAVDNEYKGYNLLYVLLCLCAFITYLVKRNKRSY